MAGDTTITLVANFRVASTPRFFDRHSGDWKAGDALFLTCNVWRQAAENVAETLQKGMRVIVQGRLKQRNYETRDGERRTAFELEVDEVGPSLRSAICKVRKRQRQSAGPGGQPTSGPPADDPWATGADSGAGGFSDDPPF